MEEHLSFPYANLSNQEEQKVIRLVDRFLKPFRAYYEEDIVLGNPIVDKNVLSRLEELIYSGYGITEIEKDLIDYVLKISRFQFQENKLQSSVRKLDNDDQVLTDYASIITNEFSALYEGESIQADIYLLDHFIAINFIFLQDDSDGANLIQFVTDLTDEMNVLSILSKTLTIWNVTNNSNPLENLYIQKDIKGFEKNSFYILKPNEYKCWHKAMAWYDIAEVREVLEKTEVELLNQKE